MFLFISETERDRAWAGEGQRARETQNPKQLWAISTEPDAGLEPIDHEIMTWAKVARSTNWATQAPLHLFIFDRARAGAGQGQTEGDTESEAGSGLRAVATEPDARFELTDREIMTWAEVGRSTYWATQEPQEVIFLN